MGRKTVPNGFFITFEGPEGAGKSTQACRLAEALRTRGYNVLETREPGGTPLGEELRRLIKHFGTPGTVCDQAELLMLGASRAQLVDRLILPCLRDDGIVVSDRFADSTTVYQGRVRGLDPAFINRLHTFTVRERWPDLTLLLDLDADTGLARTRQRRGAATTVDRFEAESAAFHQAVRQGFLDLAREFPDRIRVIPAAAAPDEVARRILEVVDRAIG